MNVLTIFDQRISAIFEEGAPGSRQPFSFKRLAKRAVREMEDETFVIDGVDTAPALYTVLVSQRDNDLMEPMYIRITDEISQLIEAQAKKRGYTFVGRPLARFMVDPALHSGRISVFAENIDPRTLARLRDEEETYLHKLSKQQVYVEQGYEPQPEGVQVDASVAEPVAVAEEVPEEVFEGIGQEIPVGQDAPVTFAADAEPVAAEAEDAIATALDVLAEPVEAEPVATAEAEPVLDLEVQSEPLPEVEPMPEPMPGLDELPNPLSSLPTFADEPIEEQADDAVDALAPAEDVAEPAVQTPPQPACSLTDLESGRTYRIASAQALIGRDATLEGVVVLDPNASRRHAELTYDGMGWRIRDLNSTNGTLVNDVDVAEAGLHDGDVLTIGLTNLEFREG